MKGTHVNVAEPVGVEDGSDGEGGLGDGRCCAGGDEHWGDERSKGEGGEKEDGIKRLALRDEDASSYEDDT